MEHKIESLTKLDLKKLQLEERIETSKRNLISDFQDLKDDLNPLNVVKKSISDVTDQLKLSNVTGIFTNKLDNFSIQSGNSSANSKGKIVSEYVTPIITTIIVAATLTWIKHGKLSLRSVLAEGISVVKQGGNIF